MSFFGAPAPSTAPAPTPSAFGFGTSSTTTGSIFDAPAPSGLFGNVLLSAPTLAGGFGAPAPSRGGGTFGSHAPAPMPQFGSTAAPSSSLFGAPAPSYNGGLFGIAPVPASSSLGGFGFPSFGNAQPPTSGSWYIPAPSYLGGMSGAPPPFSDRGRFGAPRPTNSSFGVAAPQAPAFGTTTLGTPGSGGTYDPNATTALLGSDSVTVVVQGGEVRAPKAILERSAYFSAMLRVSNDSRIVIQDASKQTFLKILWYLHSYLLGHLDSLDEAIQLLDKTDMYHLDGLKDLVEQQIAVVFLTKENVVRLLRESISFNALLLKGFALKFIARNLWHEPDLKHNILAISDGSLFQDIVRHLIENGSYHWHG